MGDWGGELDNKEQPQELECSNVCQWIFANIGILGFEVLVFEVLVQVS